MDFCGLPGGGLPAVRAARAPLAEFTPCVALHDAMVLEVRVRLMEAIRRGDVYHAPSVWMPWGTRSLPIGLRQLAAANHAASVNTLANRLCHGVRRRPVDFCDSMSSRQ